LGEIKKQGAYNTIISYLGILLGFVNILVLQPIMLEPENLGLLKVLTSSSILIGTIFPLGINGYTLKYFPLFKDKTQVHNGYLSLLVLVSLINFIIAAVLLVIFKNDFVDYYQEHSPNFESVYKYVFPIGFCIGFTSVITVFVFNLFKTIVPSIINDIVSRLMMIAITLLYFFKWFSFDQFLVAVCVVYAIQLLLLFIYSLKLNGKISWPNMNILRSIGISNSYRFMLIIAIASISSIALRNVDIMMLGSYCNMSTVAVYSIAVTIGTIIEAPVTSLARIADAKIADSFANNRLHEVQKIYFDSSRILTIVGLFLFSSVISNVSDLLVYLPKEYSTGYTVIIIISLSAVFNMITGINNSIIFYSNNHNKGTALLLILIILAVFLHSVLIPRYGQIGAAIVTAGTLFMFNLAKLLLIKSYMKIQPFEKKTLYILLTFAISLVCNFINIEQNILNVLVKECIIGLVFLLGIIFWNLMPEYKFELYLEPIVRIFRNKRSE
jgi:O-antigen/teichoic acid export membrane protein